jgi:excisionase family DNA binding protein
LDLLNEDLGKALRPNEVAEYLGVDIKTVRKYHKELGGIRLGRHYRFFEKEIFNAIQKRREMDSSSEKGWEEAEQGVFNEEGSHRVGSINAAKTRRRLDREDRHDIFG